MKKESFTSFMKQVAADLQQSGNFRNRKAWSFGK